MTKPAAMVEQPGRTARAATERWALIQATPMSAALLVGGQPAAQVELGRIEAVQVVGIDLRL